MHALIQNSAVAHVLRVAPSAIFAPAVAAQYIPAPEDVAVGWLYDGEHFVPPPPEPAPEPAPTTCTPAQGLIALYALKGLTEQQILDAIAQIPDSVQRYTAQIGYSRAITWERESQTMQAMAALLSLSEQDLDDLFAYAAGVEI